MASDLSTKIWEYTYMYIVTFWVLFLLSHLVLMGTKSVDQRVVAPSGLFFATHSGNDRVLLARDQLPCFGAFMSRSQKIISDQARAYATLQKTV